MFCARSFLFLLVFTVSVTIQGMKNDSYNSLINNYKSLVMALIEGNPEKLKSTTISPHFDPNFYIGTTCGCMDPFAYLVLQTFPDESKTCKLATILYNANVHIRLPSETPLFTVFHFVKSKLMLDYFMNKANITNPKELLDTYYTNGKETLFLKLSIELTPCEEIKKIYAAYKPNLNFKITANGTVLHHLLAFYLFSNLNAQVYHVLPVQHIEDIVSENLFQVATKYDYVGETYNKFEFFAKCAGINSLEKNEYDQTPYQFYIFLLNGLQTNILPLFIIQYPEYEDLMKILFSRKIDLESQDIPLTRFFKESFELAKLIKK
jgi:hypothetical protein